MSDFVVITGLSGAGRTNAAADLEDQGWYVVDNLPTSLVRTIVELASVPGSAIERLALVVGTSPQQADILDAIESLRTGGHRVRIVYLETSTPELVKRYGSTRRRHPMGDDTSLLEAIARERELLEPVKAMADVVIDTTALTIHQLKTRLTELFSEDAATAGMQTAIVSFGYKHGLPARRRHRARLPLPPQPVLGGAPAPADRPRPGGAATTCSASRETGAVPRAARGPPAPPAAGLRDGGQELPDHRLRVHRRPAPVRRGGRGGGRSARAPGGRAAGPAPGSRPVVPTRVNETLAFPPRRRKERTTMTVRVGINGFGRIGRNFFRAAKQSGADIDFVAVNDLGSLDTMAHLLKYDSVLGVLAQRRSRPPTDGISVDGDVLKVLPVRDPKTLPWGELGVDVVIESTGFFTDREQAAAAPRRRRAARHRLGPVGRRRRHVRVRRQRRRPSTPPRTRSSPTPRAPRTASCRWSRCSTTPSAWSRA